MAMREQVTVVVAELSELAPLAVKQPGAPPEPPAPQLQPPPPLQPTSSDTRASCLRFWLHVRTVAAIGAQVLCIYTASHTLIDEYDTFADAYVAGALLTLAFLLFDLLNRSDLLSQVLWLSDCSNINTGCGGGRVFDAHTDPTVIDIYQESQMSRFGTYALVARSTAAFALAYSVMFRPRTTAFAVVWYNEALYFVVWVSMVRVRSTLRWDRASALRKELHARHMEELRTQHTQRMAQLMADHAHAMRRVLSETDDAPIPTCTTACTTTANTTSTPWQSA